jgi:hypothetical protein
VLPPNTMYFQILKKGQPLEDSVISAITMFLVKDGKKISNPNSMDQSATAPILDDTSFIRNANPRYTSNLQDDGVLVNGNASSYYGYYGVDTWYLEYPDGDVDTIYLEVGDISGEEGAKHRCYCTKPFTVMRFNGKDAAISTTLVPDDGKPVYIFEK